VLPLLFGGHLLVVGGRGVEFLLGSLLCKFGLVRDAGFGRGDEGPDGKGDEDGVNCSGG
jgi:hypothetical protein